MNDLTIYITTYKDFTPVVSNPCYKILDAREFRGSDILDDRFFSEIYMMSKIKPDTKYVGFCMYRKYFEFLDNIPDMDKIFENHDVITLKPMTLRCPILKHYSLCHNGDDLEIIKNIIYNDYSEYKADFDAFMMASTFFPCNMFIMKASDFQEYINFVKGVLDKYIELVGTDIRQRIINNKNKYMKTFSPNNTIEYQYRIGGYLAERLTNVFLMSKFKKMKTYPVILTLSI